MDDLKARIQEALNTGATQLATTLAQQGLLLYPDDVYYQKVLQVCAPPRVVGTRPASLDPVERQKTSTWVQQNWTHYTGKWLAVKDGELLGHADTLQELRDTLRDRDLSGVAMYHIVHEIVDYYTTRRF